MGICLPQNDQTVLQEIRALNLNALTPLQALGRLAELQKMLSNETENRDGQD